MRGREESIWCEAARGPQPDKRNVATFINRNSGRSQKISADGSDFRSRSDRATFAGHVEVVVPSAVFAGRVMLRKQDLHLLQNADSSHQRPWGRRRLVPFGVVLSLVVCGAVAFQCRPRSEPPQSRENSFRPELYPARSVSRHLSGVASAPRSETSHFAVAFELESGAAVLPEIGAMSGANAVSETALVRNLFLKLPSNSVVMGDAGFGIYAVANEARETGHDFLWRLTAARFKTMVAPARLVPQQGGGDLLLETLDQFAAGGDETLLGLTFHLSLQRCFRIGIGIPKTLVESFDVVEVGVRSESGQVAGEADFDVFLREIVLVDQDFADLVGGFGVFAFVGVVVVE